MSENLASAEGRKAPPPALDVAVEEDAQSNSIEAAKLLCSGPPSAATLQSIPRSPWLPPASPGRQRTPPRRADPLNTPECVDLVLPSWRPYQSPPYTPQHGKRRKGGHPVKQARWCKRHHIIDSKDNRRLPRLQRSYFDDLPHTRCQGGEYKMVPGHRSRNFDHFCSAPANEQKRELSRRFQRYPFVEASREVDRYEDFYQDSLSRSWSAIIQPEPSETSSNSSRESDRDDEPRQQLRPQQHLHSVSALTTKFVGDGSSTSLWGAEEEESEFRQASPSKNPKSPVRRLASLHFNDKTNDESANATRVNTPPLLKERPPESFTRFKKLSTESTHHTKTKLNPVKKREVSSNMTKFSIFAKGGLPQFHAWCASKFGSLVRLWRCLDVNNNMRIAQTQFLRGLQDLGYSGDARELFKTLNRDQTGTLLFYHFAPEAALAVAEFLHWARSNFGGLVNSNLLEGLPPGSKIGKPQFIEIVKKKGFQNHSSLSYAFDLLDKDGSGAIEGNELKIFDSWDFPEWLTAEPDEQAAAICKKKVVDRCHGNVLAAWRHMDRNATMRIAWNDFRMASRKFLPQEDHHLLPSAWRALDDDMSGWLSLREFDWNTHHELTSFIEWVHEAFGTFVAAFPKLAGNQITQSEFRAICRPSGLGDQVINKIFQGLDIDSTGTIEMSEIRFLDQWKASADLKEEEAWALITQSQTGSARAGQERKKTAVGSLGTARSSMD